MSVRIVSLVSIAAIVACPLWCGGGQRCDTCESASDAHDVCSTQGATDCCGKQSSPAEDDNHHRPGPKKSSCQGVCGGAVLEKPSELPAHDDCLSLPPIDVKVAGVCLLVERSTIDFGVDCHSGGNHGRLLRALYMSFLC